MQHTKLLHQENTTNSTEKMDGSKSLKLAAYAIHIQRLTFLAVANTSRVDLFRTESSAFGISLSNPLVVLAAALLALRPNTATGSKQNSRCRAEHLTTVCTPLRSVPWQ